MKLDEARTDGVDPRTQRFGGADELLAGWRQAGVEPGMHLIVHSALSRIGQVQGGASTVVQTLRDAVGPEGTLVTPAFTPQVADPSPQTHGVSDTSLRRLRHEPAASP